MEFPGTSRRAAHLRERIGRVAPRSESSGGPADQELVARVIGGEGAAFATIVERYQDRLHNTVLRLVGSAEDARDLVQDTFVKAYENLGGFRGGSSLYTWLFRIAVNTSLSHRRKKKWTRPLSAADDDDPPAAEGLADPHAADPAAPLMAAETETLVQQALGSLDEEHRTVIVLRDIEQCDYHQMAEILEVPAGTVKSRLHRARLMLRDKLKPLLKQ